MFLNATRREFERGYQANIRLAGTAIISSESLMLVYGLECGLKALIMKERGADITSEVALIAEIGHDLRACLKALRAPAALVLSSTKTNQKQPQVVTSSMLHQAFRYGIDLQNRDTIIDQLKKVHEWLTERMR